MAARIKKGDRVVITAGRDKGAEGEVIRIITQTNRALVRGVNMVRRHQRQTQTNQGGIIEKEAPIHLSNVALIDPDSGKATRVGFKTDDKGKKQRYAKKSGKIIENAS